MLEVVSLQVAGPSTPFMGHHMYCNCMTSNGCMSPHPKLHQCNIISLCANYTNRNIAVEIIQKLFIITVQCVGELHIYLYAVMNYALLTFPHVHT